jgi:hypothetical protein
MQAGKMAAFLEKNQSRLAVSGTPEWDSLTDLIAFLRRADEVSIDKLVPPSAARTRQRRSTPAKSPPQDIKAVATRIAAALRAVRLEPGKARAVFAEALPTLTAPIAKQLASELNLGAAKTKEQAIAKVQGWITTEGRLRDNYAADVMAE